ncbi:EamA family transporter (plasmid) [Streptomyces sp. BI20]|uniref:EamA family transporter n=1 Tax=Streptomyces sp. BI20 TaxID=3403460 RepID=UPI003C7708FC
MGLSGVMVGLLTAGWLLSGRLVVGVPPLAVATGRTASAFLVLAVVAAARARGRAGARAMARRPGAVAVLAALGFFGYYAGTLLGTRLIGAAPVGLIVSLLPCVTFVVGACAFGEPSGRYRIAGTVVAGVGAVGFLVADGAGRSGTTAVGGGPGVLAAGAGLAFAGTLAYAFYGYAYRRAAADLPTSGVLPVVTGAGAVMLGVVTALFTPWGGVPASGWWGVAVLGGVLTAPMFLVSHELILLKGPLFTAALGLAVPPLVRCGEWALGTAPAPGPAAGLFVLLAAVGVVGTVRAPAPRTG